MWWVGGSYTLAPHAVEIASHRLTRTLCNVHDVTTLNEGAGYRRVRSTSLNAESSRSHAVVTFYVTRPAETTDASVEGVAGAVAGASAGVDGELLIAKMHLVDLAGSERVKESGVTGAGLREAAQINASLLALIRVVKLLAERPSKTRGGDGGNVQVRPSVTMFQS